MRAPAVEGAHLSVTMSEAPGSEAKGRKQENSDRLLTRCRRLWTLGHPEMGAESFRFRRQQWRPENN